MCAPGNNVCVHVCTVTCTPHTCLLRYHGHRDALLPLMAIQASFFLLCAASCSGVTSRSTPPTPVRSTPEWPNLTQSMSEWPGFRATLLRGLPAITHSRVYRRVQAGEKNVSSITGPSTFCAVWFGGHLRTAPAPRHNANRYGQALYSSRAVYRQTADDAHPHSTPSSLYSQYLWCCFIPLPPFS